VWWYLVIPLELVDVVVRIVEREDVKGLAGRLRHVIPSCRPPQWSVFAGEEWRCVWYALLPQTKPWMPFLMVTTPLDSKVSGRFGRTGVGAPAQATTVMARKMQIGKTCMLVS
jgi:hypothetical protein